MPIPSLAEQSEIVHEIEHRLSAADRLAATLDQQLDRAYTMRQSFFREALAGRLVLQDPKDEPAPVLLERIRVARQAESQKPKVKRMKKSKLSTTHRPLLDILRENKKPIKPEQLFHKAGFKPSQVDLFYRELASLRDKLQLEKPNASEAKSWPYRANVTLQLKED